MREYPYPQRLVPHILEERAREKGEAHFLLFGGETVSYREMQTRACQAANGYRALGVGKGDFVAAMLPNCPEFLAHWFGLARLGAVDTPINPAYKGEFLRHALANVRARVLLVHQDLLERVEAVGEHLPDLETVVVLHPKGEPPRQPLNWRGRKRRIVSFETFAEADREFIPSEPLQPSDPMMTIYTSGTTGASKGVLLSHHALYCYASDAVRMRGLSASDILFTCLPLYHINARFMTVMPALLTGATVALSERYSASGFWEEIRRHQATVFTFLGGIPAIMLGRPEHPDDGNNPVRMAFGGPLTPIMAQRMEARFRLKVYTGFYGMTEAIGVTYLSAAEMDDLKQAGNWEAVLGMGRVNPELYEARLVDDQFNEVAVNEPGELVCRPTRPHSMMSEYVNMPEKTVEAFGNLWFHTGDLARRDGQGFFYFVDRKKDYIRRSGENISSFEVEKVVNAHPAVGESAAIAVQSAMGEDEVLIVVRAAEGTGLTPLELMEWCEERMPYFMVPRYVRFITEDFPRTPTSRIQKFELRAQGITPDSWDREQAGYTLKR